MNSPPHKWGKFLKKATGHFADYAKLRPYCSGITGETL